MRAELHGILYIRAYNFPNRERALLLQPIHARRFPIEGLPLGGNKQMKQNRQNDKSATWTVLLIAGCSSGHGVVLRRAAREEQAEWDKINKPGKNY